MAMSVPCYLCLGITKTQTFPHKRWACLTLERVMASLSTNSSLMVGLQFADRPAPPPPHTHKAERNIHFQNLRNLGLRWFSSNKHRRFFAHRQFGPDADGHYHSSRECTHSSSQDTLSSSLPPRTSNAKPVNFQPMAIWEVTK